MEVFECKYCKSKNLMLESRVSGENVMTANMVALKCADCGKWIKWCPKEDRHFYIKEKEKTFTFTQEQLNQHDTELTQPLRDEIERLQCDLENQTAYDLKESHEYAIKKLIKENKRLSERIQQERQRVLDELLEIVNKEMAEVRETKGIFSSDRAVPYAFSSGRFVALGELKQKLNEMKGVNK